MPLVTRIGNVREKTISSDESYPGVFQRSIAESAALYARDMLISPLLRKWRNFLLKTSTCAPFVLGAPYVDSDRPTAPSLTLPNFRGTSPWSAHMAILSPFQGKKEPAKGENALTIHFSPEQN